MIPDIFFFLLYSPTFLLKSQPLSSHRTVINLTSNHLHFLCIILVIFKQQPHCGTLAHNVATLQVHAILQWRTWGSERLPYLRSHGSPMVQSAFDPTVLSSSKAYRLPQHPLHPPGSPSGLGAMAPSIAAHQDSETLVQPSGNKQRSFRIPQRRLLTITGSLVFLFERNVY